MKYSVNVIYRGESFRSDNEAAAQGYKFAVRHQMMSGTRYFQSWTQAQDYAQINKGMIFDLETLSTPRLSPGTPS
jgi:hypothetical protein